MGFADRAGYATVNAQAPRAFGVCDYCGTWWQRNRLIPQMEWTGDGMIDQGLRACPRCISKPQDQFRTPILPPDPRPIDNPRPEVPVINQNLNNWRQVVGPQAQTLQQLILAEFDPTQPILDKNTLLTELFNANMPVPILTDDDGSLLTDDFGNVFLQEHVNDLSGTIALSGVGQQLAPANLQRDYLLIYNPYGGLLVAAQGAPAIGGRGTVVIGTGSPMIQALQSPIWQAAIYVMGLLQGSPFLAYEGFGVVVSQPPAPTPPT